MSASSEFLASVVRQKQLLQESVEQLHALVDQLALARVPQADALPLTLQTAVEYAIRLRSLLGVTAEPLGVAVGEWNDLASFEQAVQNLAEAVHRKKDMPRAKLRAVAAELLQGHIQHRRPARRTELLHRRELAHQELLSRIDLPLPPQLPGPENGGWFAWWWSQAGEEQDRILASLSAPLPGFVAFLEMIEPDFCPAVRSTPDVPLPAMPLSVSNLENVSVAVTAVTAPPASEPTLPPVVEPTPPVALLPRDHHQQNGFAPTPTPAHETPSEPVSTPEPEIVAESPKVVAEIEEVPETLPPLPLTEPDANLEDPEPPAIAIPVRQTTKSSTPRPQESPPQPQPEPQPQPSEEEVFWEYLVADLQSSPPATVVAEDYDFERFRASHWLSPAGKCSRSPWLDSEAFLMHIHAAWDDVLYRQNWHHAWLLAHTAELFGDWRSHPRSEDIESFCDIWLHPLDSSAGRDQKRSELIYQADSIEASSRWRLALALEAMRPSPEQFRLSPADVSAFLEVVQYESTQLHEVVKGLLCAAALGADPVPRLREELQANDQYTLESLQQQHDKAREHLRAIAKMRWQAAGGTIQRTHCRRAWDDYINFVRPVIEKLYPLNFNGAEDWDVELCRQQILTFDNEFKRLIEDYGVKFQDRTAFERAAREIATAAAAVNDILDQLHRFGGRRPALAALSLPVSAMQALIKSLPLSSVIEEACRLLLLRQLELLPESDSTGMNLTLRDFVAYPDWLTLVDPAHLAESPGVASATRFGKPASKSLLSIKELQDPIRATAIFLSDPEALLVRRDGGSDQEALARRLRAHPRRELAARVPMMFGPTREQALIHEDRSEKAERLHGQRTRLWELIQDLETLLFDVTQLRSAHEQCGGLLERENLASEDQELLEPWLDQLVNFAEQQRDYELRRRILQAREELQGHPQQASLLERIESAIKGRMFSLVVPLLQGQAPLEQVRFRETFWRHEVEARFGKSDRAARKLKNLQDEVAQTWKPITGAITAADRPLRTTLARYLYPETPAKAGESLYRKARNEAHFFAIDTEHLREHLNRTNRNPCWLPQLARFKALVLLTPRVPLTARSFKEQTRTQIAEHKDDLCVLLLPQLPSQMRRELQTWCRECNTALFDDYDLCRLLLPDAKPSPTLNTRPEPLLGFLEIVIEQLRWRDVSPFRTDDGQRVPLEMFVGRRVEASRVALTADVARVFSGRKLGKSALMRFICKTYDDHQLPSGHRLRVVYVPAAGIDDEAALVSAILRNLPNNWRNEIRYETPGERLLGSLMGYRQSHPEESLLIVLDEADTFVEAQVLEYARRKEKCLSFQIRAQLMSETDIHDLPRIRVVYSGYRSTNTREGVWGGSGSDVLFLRPLPLEEAVKLVAGPLARLGIDASREALPIAHRCGCQPTVLLRFGACLLERLESKFPPATRERSQIVVTSEDVSAVFADARVHEEIWSITQGNFQANERGFLVFAALLLEFAARSPGAWLSEAEERVATRLQSFDESGLIFAAGHDPQETLEPIFADFVERQLLLTKSAGETQLYSLQFPHHLPVLLMRNLEREMHSSLRRLQEGADGALPRTLLRSGQLQELHQQMNNPQTRAIVVVSQWPSAFEDPVHGLAVWLNLLYETPDCIIPDAQLTDADAQRERLLVTQATPRSAEILLSQRMRGLAPIVLSGDLDLLRWALRGSEEGVVICCPGRLPPVYLRGWFTRVRALEFDKADALAVIHERTSGVPVLVGILDRLFADQGDTISNREFQSVIERFDEEFARLETLALSEREVQLLRIVETIGRENLFAEHLDIVREMACSWELYQEQLTIAPFDASEGSEDRLALRLLALTGILPCDAKERPVVLPQGDAIRRLLERVEQRQRLPA